MAELANRQPQDPIASAYHNQIRDRTVQRYSSVSDRTSKHPTPSAGDLSYLADSGDLDVYHGGAWRHIGDQAGVVKILSAGSIPAGWLLCDGAAVSRTTYAGLFAVYNASGLPYGAGDGSTTFNLPDLRQRAPYGVAASGVGSTLGEAFGTINHVHTGPSHTHTGPAHTHTVGNTGNPTTLPQTASAGAHVHDLGSSASAGAHTHSFSDSFTTGSNSTSQLVAVGNHVNVADHPHSHSGSVSGTTGSGGGHTHDLGDAASGGAHTHAIPNHAHTNGATGSAGTGATGASGTANTGTANPPGLAMNYIVKT